MNVPHQPPHPVAADPLDRALADLGSSLERELGKTGDSVQGLRERIAAAPPSLPSRPLDRPPAGPAAAPGRPKWGPSTTRITAPLETFEAVAQSAYELRGEVEALLRKLTGEEPQRRTVRSAFPQGPLLPGIVALATAIEGVLNDVRRLVGHMEGRL